MTENYPNIPPAEQPRTPFHHPYPAPDLHLPPPPPQPPKKGHTLAKVLGVAVVVLFVVIGIGDLAKGPGPATEPPTPTPAAARATKAPSTHTPETREPAPRKAEADGSVFDWDTVEKEMRSRGFVVAGQEISNDCLDGADFTNGALTIGLIVVSGCDNDATLDSTLELLAESPGSYTHYLRGDNWLGAFESKAAAKSFAVGTDLKVKAL